MKKKTIVALLGALVLAVAAPISATASSGHRVTVQIKLGKVLHTYHVSGERGWITKGGTPRGKCPGASAAGALDRATHGRWTGRYYRQYSDLLVSSILGVKAHGGRYWWLYVNGRSASVGVCAVKLRAGEKLLFKLIK